jgi:hypothetical protein
MDRVRVLADEVTLSAATNLSKATAVRVVNDTAATIVLTVDDGPVVSIEAGGVLYLEKDPLETINGSGLKCTKIARQ